MNEDEKTLVDTLMVNIVVQGASIEALFSLCRSIAQRGGISEVDGTPIEDWFQQQKLLQLEAALIGIENKTPSYAALLQSIVDESRSRIKGDNPE